MTPTRPFTTPIHLRLCQNADLSNLLTIQQEAITLLNHPHLLRQNTPEMLSCCLNPPHVTMGAWDGSVLAGFAILYFGGHTNENLGKDMNISLKDLSQIANLKLVIVRPSYRGQQLQRLLCTALEPFAIHQQILYLCCTIDPANQVSVKNFESIGYQYHKKIIKYNQLPRLLYVKPLGYISSSYMV